MNNVFKSRKGQGVTEYIVMLGLIVAAVYLLWPIIGAKLSAKATAIAGSIT